MITSSTCDSIASVIAAKSSISYDGTPSGVRAWMWIIDAPSPTARFASAAYSSGVYGIAGHWSRFAIVPEIAQVITTGSSRAIGSPPGAQRPEHLVAGRGDRGRRPRGVLAVQLVLVVGDEHVGDPARR